MSFSNKKRYRIKYEDTKGDCRIEVVYAYNYTDVGRRLLYPVRDVYWIREETEPITPKIKNHGI